MINYFSVLKQEIIALIKCISLQYIPVHHFFYVYENAFVPVVQYSISLVFLLPYTIFYFIIEFATIMASYFLFLFDSL